MKIGMTYRLFLAILIATGLALLALILIMAWSINRGFYQYLGRMDQSRLEQLALELSNKYDRQKNWDFLKDEPTRHPVGGPDRPPGKGFPPPPSFMEKEGAPMHPPPHVLEPKNEPGPLVILNAEKKVVWGVPQKYKDVNYRPITVRGETVGYVGLLSPKHFLHPMQIRFLSQQRFALALAAAVMVLIVAILSLPLARRLVKPVRAMAEATHDIAAGRYSARIPVTSSDELGQLARAFNDMALTLEKNEKERRQWVADISHELRTPVSVLQGEIEALLDNIRPVTTDTIRSLHTETLRLKHLINDLYQLSLSDIGALAYRKENLNINEILREILESYRLKFSRKGIVLTEKLPQDRGVTVFADSGRLDQLFINLFENSLRYTDEEGILMVSLTIGGGNCIIEFRDSKPGVPDEELEKLFDRLYRVEGSRSRQSGGAGLGLAICKNIVDAHEGTISAHPSPLGGLLIRITLPILEGLS